MHSDCSQECPFQIIQSSQQKYFETQIDFKYMNGEIRVEVKMNCSNEKVCLMVDTGADISILKPDKVSKDSIIHHGEKVTVSGVTDPKRISSIGRLTSKLHINNIAFPHDFQVIIDERIRLRCDGILGSDFLLKYGANINFESFQIKLRYQLESFQIKSVTKNEHFYENFEGKFDKEITLKPIPNHFSISVLRSDNSDKVKDPDERTRVILKFIDMSKLSDEQKNCLFDMCFKYCRAFLLEGDAFKHTNVTEHFIELKPGTTPIFIKQYRIPESHKFEIQRQISELESKGIIEKSDSPWNSPLLLVPKKTECKNEKKFRMVIDYRKLNSVTISQSYPIPLVDEIIDQMRGAKIFTVLDLHGAFHQIPLSEKCKQYTAFSTAYDKYHFNSSPFGLVGSPFTWLRTISTVLKGIVGRNVFVYMDDIIIHSKTIMEHRQTIETVLKKLIEHNLKLNIEKSKFFQSEVSYLGHIISAEGMKTDPRKTSCMNKFPTPTNVTDIQRFLGMCNYYRRYVEGYAKIARPLYQLCRKDVPFLWSDKCENAFNQLKASLTSPPILIFPDFSDTFIVTTDASEFAIGAVISQGYIPNDRPIQFFSKSLSKAQINYSTIEKELLAILTAVETFKYYLYGRIFLIVTDHKPLTYLLTSKNLTGRLHRWKFSLMEFQFKIVHRKGTQNVVADALSRINIPEEKCEEHKLSIAQTRQGTRNNAAGKDTRIFFPEKCNMLIELKDFDHIFYFFENTNCRMHKNLEHKLKTKLNVPEFFLENELFSVNENRTVARISSVLRTEKQIKDIESCLEKITKFCKGKNFQKIAFNVDFRELKDYLQFKFSLHKLTEGTNLEITIYLNKVIELTLTEDINKVLEAYHDTKLGGHAGFERMKNTIRRHFSWPRMSKDIKKYVENCSVCEQSKVQRHTKAPLQISSTASEPFEKIYLDLVGPISPQSEDGNKYIFTCNCDLSKYAIAVAIPDATALTTAKSLIHNIILRYGIPKEIVTDNGTNFISQTLKEVNRLLKVKRIFTTPYHPQSNQVERFHRSLSEYLKAYIQSDQTNWDKYIDYAIFCYNITCNSSTGFTPFELVFGRKMELPCGFTKDSTPIYNYDNYASDLRTKLKMSYELARENLIKRKQQNKIQHDRRLNNVSLRRNDLVLVIKNQKDGKFERPYEGPYRVERMVTPVIVQLRKGKKPIRVHIDKVKKARASYEKVPPIIA